MIVVTRTARRMAVAAAIAAVAAVTLALDVPVTTSAALTLTAARAAASTPKCAAADLGVWVAYDQSQGAAGTLIYPLEFTNLSHHACTLHGFPGVSALGRNGKQLGSPAAWDHAVKARTVRLAPGATAHAMLAYSDVITGNCPSASKRTAFALRVYPPDRRKADHAFWSLAACTAKGSSHFMRVRVIAAGIGVRGDND